MKIPERMRCVVAVVGVLLILVSPLSAKKYVLRFNHSLDASEPYHTGFLEWAENVDKRTNGDVRIEVFHSAQLGVEEDIINQIKQGASIGQNTDSFPLATYVPEIAVIGLPYFVDSIDDVISLKNSPMVKSWLEELDKSYGIKVLSFYWVEGFRQFVSNKPIRTPKDLEGLRIRTSHAVTGWRTFVLACGATPVDLAFFEMRMAFQQDIIDGSELVYNNIATGRFYEILPYVSETKHGLLINFEVVSSEFFNSLPSKYQKILVEECDNAGLKTSNLIVSRQENDVKNLIKQKGMTIIEDVDIDAFRKKGEISYKLLRLTDIRDQLYNELGKKIK